MRKRKFRLLVVEDKEDELDTCRGTIARYNDEKDREVELVECRSVEEFHSRSDNAIDGAIIDLTLAGRGDEGNQVISEIAESLLRIPVAVLTGTPDNADTQFANIIGVFKKGDFGAGYDDLMDKFWEIHNTGLTRIMGGRGVIEKNLNKVYLENLLPQINKWTIYATDDSGRTEQALLRHTLNHLLQLLDDNEDRYFPEEFYLDPPLTENIWTGSIVKEKTSDKRFVVMTPACDLVVRSNGDFKTDCVLLVEIEEESDILNSEIEGITRASSKKRRLREVFGNNHTSYYHWLPETSSFDGGILNFRKLSTYNKKVFDDNFESPVIQISPSFVKDIVARFSSYYARQGQPDVESDVSIERFLATQSGDPQ